ncbi:RDD family protein [Parvibaculum sp.]|uniref:RDD family protein n=1 Tax=Parvibaculum sp. TaxID=2024848 RepID=UPI000C8E2619|nr:RDD family protein [Parvibaculum sp.]MAB13832.1 RDD family protein [Parvibaculum sp.]
MNFDNDVANAAPVFDGEETAWPAGSFDGVVFRRLVALFADLLILIVLVSACYILLAIFGILTLGIAWLAFGLVPIVPFLYFGYYLGGPTSATPGMSWQGIEVRTWNGRRPGFIQGALHALVAYGIFAISSLVFFLTLLMPFFNSRKRFLHDYLCGTVVVRRQI